MTTQRLNEAQQMRRSLNVLREFSHPKPKPTHKTEFENWPKLLGRDWTSVRQSCESCGSYEGLGYLVRDIDWFNICPQAYDQHKDKAQWEEPADAEERRILGDSVNRFGGGGAVCLSCFDAYAAALGKDYEITLLFFNGLRQSFDVVLPKGIKIRRHSRRDMYRLNPELKPGIRHPDHPGDRGWTDAEDGMLKSQIAARAKLRK